MKKIPPPSAPVREVNLRERVPGIKNMKTRNRLVACVWLLAAGTSLAAISFTDDFATDPAGIWNPSGTTPFHWVPGHVTADNIQGYQLGTYSRSFSGQVTGSDDWNAQFSLMVNSAAITYNSFRIGVMNPSGWAGSDFAGLWVGDGSGSPAVMAMIQDGATSVNSYPSGYFSFASGTSYLVDLTYTGATKTMDVTFSDLAHTVVGTASVSFPGAQLAWSNFGLGNTADGMGYTTNGLNLTSFTDLSFNGGPVPEPATLGLLLLGGLLLGRRPLGQRGKGKT